MKLFENFTIHVFSKITNNVCNGAICKFSFYIA